MDYIYDCETYPNLFSLCAVDEDAKNGWMFEISERRDNTKQLLNFLRKLIKEKGRMVGFNNEGFDYPIIHYIMMRAKEAKLNNEEFKITPYEIYLKAQEIIESQYGDDRVYHKIKDDEVLIQQVDLYKVHHFDNKAKATSLKMLEFNMKSDNIEDLPFPVGSVLTSEQMNVTLKYNAHDVLQTRLFYLKSKGALDFRKSLSEKYGRNFTNHNDTKIGKDYFIMRLEEVNPSACYKMQGKRRVMNQTKREKINIKDILFPYLEFEREEFKAVKKWFAEQTITETKGVFSDIEEHRLGDLAKYCTMVEKRKKLKEKPTDEELVEMKKELPLCWIDEVVLKSGKISYYKKWRIAKTLNVVVDGFQFDFGTGGIHGSIESAIVESDDDYLIVDEDVSSFYPNLAIKNRVYPEHLGELFCDIYEDVYNERKKYAKGSDENAVMKLALNGVYGDSNNQYSPFYDPQYTMTITINGQLSLCMLAEKLLTLGDVQMIQANTDGITVKCKRDKLDQLTEVTKWWENITLLELERNDYSKMIIRDVNNYLAIYDGTTKVKRKGAYEYDDLGWHQNHSALIIPKAAEAVLVHGAILEEYIKGHKDKWDFMLRTKVPRSSRLVLVMEDGAEFPQQNICRYYPCKDGGNLVKIMPPLEGKDEERRIGIDKQWKVKTCNDISKFEWDIDYNYYIAEASKLIDAVTSSDEEVDE